VALGGLSVTPSVAQVAEPPPDSSFQKVTLDSPASRWTSSSCPICACCTPRATVRCGCTTRRPGWTRSRPRSMSSTTRRACRASRDANFKGNKWVYLYYPATAGHSGGRSVRPRVNEGNAPEFGTPADFAPFKGVSRLSRFKLTGDKLDLGSEQLIIEVAGRPRHLLPYGWPDRLRRAGQPVPVDRRRLISRREAFHAS
jgi:cytochrome c